MSIVASRFINCSALGKIVLAALIGGACAVFVAAAVVLGSYAMTQKPSSKKPAKKSAAINRTSGDRT